MAQKSDLKCQHSPIDLSNDEPTPSSASVKRKLSVRQSQGPLGISLRDSMNPTSHTGLIPEHDHDHVGGKQRQLLESDVRQDNAKISLPSTSKQALSMITPFLTRHIPSQYNPLGLGDQPQSPVAPENTNTKYCYRHRPDLKCRRQADEPSMEQLQGVGSFKPSFSLENAK
jgi:hypothetical protein